MTSAGGTIDLNELGIRFKDWQGNNQLGWVTYIGAQQRAATGNISDCLLLELNRNVVSGLFSLGWSKAPLPPDFSTVLHHPNGDVMKISHESRQSVSNPNELNFGGITVLPPFRAWSFNTGQTIEGDFGVLEIGSSGSAMINPDHRIVGQAFGGERLKKCNDIDKTFWFGRFDKSWDLGSTPAERLIDWLDPVGTNTLDINASYQLGMPSSVIPCHGIEQDVNAPSLSTLSGTNYTYNWRASPYIEIVGTGSNVRYKTKNGCAGCPGWVECDIATPGECGGHLVATSVRKNITWTNLSATNFKHTISPATINNGYNLGSFNNVCAFEQYHIQAGFQGIAIPSNTVIQWTHSGNITPVSTANGWGFGFIVNSSGMFTLTATIVSGTGCLAGKSETYVFQALFPCNSWQMIGNKKEGHFNEDTLQVYPNPANSQITLQVPEDFILNHSQIYLTDFLGRVVASYVLTDTYQEMDVSHLIQGVYLLEIRGDNIHDSRKIIINR